jgi:uncharacterized membrane protein
MNVKFLLALFAAVTVTWRAYPKLTEMALYTGTEKRQNFKSGMYANAHVIVDVYYFHFSFEIQFSWELPAPCNLCSTVKGNKNH